MESNLITIIIPAYNVEKYIERCLESVLSQELKNFEVIIVDDGSSDSTPQICDNYEKRYQNIKVIHKKNSGLGFARNTGLEYAKGEYIVFLDGDDFVGKNHLSNLYNCIKANKADTCLCGYTRYKKDGSEIKHKHIYANQCFDKENIVRKIIPKLCGKKPDKTDDIEMSVCMAMFSNKIIKNNTLRFPSEREMISEDLIFGLEYYKYSNRICFSESVEYRYCDNEGSLTTKYRADRFDKQVVLTKEVSKRVQKMQIFNLCEQRIYNTLISIARYSIKLEVKFKNNNGKEYCMNNIMKICCNSYLVDIFNKYDDLGTPWKTKIVNNLIKKKRYNTLYFVMYIKNKLNI